MSSIVEQALRPNAKRVTFGIDIRTVQGGFTLNEWGLHETQAKEVNELLVLNNNEPVELEGLIFSRRAPSTLSQKLAEMKANLAAKVAPSAV